jgi:hypothetical protein
MTAEEIQQALREAFPDRWKATWDVLDARRKTDREAVDRALADFTRAFRSRGSERAEDEIVRMEKRVHAPYQPFEPFGVTEPVVGNGLVFLVHASQGTIVRRVDEQNVNLRLATARSLRRLVADEEVRQAAYASHDGRLFRTDFMNGVSREIADGLGSEGGVHLARCAESFAAAGSLSGRVRRWRWDGGELPAVEVAGELSDFGAAGIALSPDGRLLAWANDAEIHSHGLTDDTLSPGSIRIVSLEGDATGREIARVEEGARRPVRYLDVPDRDIRAAWEGEPLVFSADGTRLVAWNRLYAVPDLADQALAIPGTNRLLLRTATTVLVWDLGARSVAADLSDALRPGETMDPPRGMSISTCGRAVTTVERTQLRSWSIRPW